MANVMIKKTRTGLVYLVDGKLVILLRPKTNPFDPRQYMNILRMVTKNKCPNMD